MIDDRLTLTAIPDDAPYAEPGAATVFAQNDGSGVTRVYARTDDGEVFALTPVPVAPMPATVTLRTPGYDSVGQSARPLTSGEHVAMFLGIAHGSSAEVLWGLHAPVATGWTELAIAVRVTPALGSVQMRYVGAVDITTEAGTYVPGPWRSTIPITGVEPGAELYLVVATWYPPGQPTPLVLEGASWTDTLGSGLVGVLGGDAGLSRPSALRAAGLATQTFAVVPWTRPLISVVTVQ